MPAVPWMLNCEVQALAIIYPSFVSSSAKEERQLSS